MSSSSGKPKTDQLARIRRNQQRCRERKRAHVAELESQVEDLKAKIRQCEPCASTRPPEHENELDKALRENAARQHLLSALGFDDETQRRFIESAAKRDAVFTILHGDGDRTGSSQTTREPPVETSPAPVAGDDALPAKFPAEFADLRSSTDQATNLFDMNAELENITICPQTENWLLSPQTLEKLPPFSMELSDDSSLLKEFNDRYGEFLEGTVNASEPDYSMPSIETMSTLPTELVGVGPQWMSSPSNSSPSVPSESIERCFLETVVQSQPTVTSTVCSIALSLIFRYNRKGLRMAELQKLLRPGMRAPAGVSAECRIEDDVLFQVLAEISNVK